MKKRISFVLAAAVMLTLLLGGCGKGPTEDLSWYPEDRAGEIVKSFSMERKPGEPLRSDIKLGKRADSVIRVRWKAGDERTEGPDQTQVLDENGSELKMSWTMPENGVCAADLPAMAAAVDDWMTEQEGGDRAYSLSGSFYSAELLGENGRISDLSDQGMLEAVYSLRDKTVRALEDPADFQEKDSFGFLIIGNTDDEIYAGGERDFRYLIHVIP